LVFYSSVITMTHGPINIKHQIKVCFVTTATTKWGPPYRRDITNSLRLGSPRNFGLILGIGKIFVFSEKSRPTLPPSPPPPNGEKGFSPGAKGGGKEAALPCPPPPPPQWVQRVFPEGKATETWSWPLTFIQWRAQEFCTGGFNKFSSGQRTERTGIWGGSPLVRGSGGSCNLVQEISFHIVRFS